MLPGCPSQRQRRRRGLVLLLSSPRPRCRSVAVLQRRCPSQNTRRSCSWPGTPAAFPAVGDFSCARRRVDGDDIGGRIFLMDTLGGHELRCYQTRLQLSEHVLVRTASRTWESEITTTNHRVPTSVDEASAETPTTCAPTNLFTRDTPRGLARPGAAKTSNVWPAAARAAVVARQLCVRGWCGVGV